MKGLKKYMKNLLKDESGQGTTEYILILVVVLGIAIVFGPKIKEIVTNKMQDVGGNIQGFNP